MKYVHVALSLVMMFGLVACGGGAETIPEVTSTPAPAAQSINSLLKRYQVVALSELHYNKEIWDVVEQVLDSRQFQDEVIDIALEGGNSGLQAVMDDYVSNGTATEAQVKRAWRDNTQVNTTYDAPVYLRMVNHIRALNAKRNVGRRSRVILLDPAIDWSKVKGMDDYLPYLLDREPSMVRVIERETYAKGGKLLFIAGGPHVERSATSSNVKSALSQLETAHAGSTITVAFYSGFGVEAGKLDSLELNFSSWPKPGIALLKGTPLGAQPAGINTAAKGPDGKPIDLYPGVKLQEIFDAILYAGRRGELQTSSPSEGICTGKADDIQWKAELLARQELVNVPPPLRTNAEKICAPLPRLYFDQEIFK